jgi:hypothetical protein
MEARDLSRENDLIVWEDLAIYMAVKWESVIQAGGSVSLVESEV